MAWETACEAEGEALWQLNRSANGGRAGGQVGRQVDGGQDGEQVRWQTGMEKAGAEGPEPHRMNE